MAKATESTRLLDLVVGGQCRLELLSATYRCCTFQAGCSVNVLYASDWGFEPRRKAMKRVQRKDKESVRTQGFAATPKIEKPVRARSVLGLEWTLKGFRRQWGCRLPLVYANKLALLGFPRLRMSSTYRFCCSRPKKLNQIDLFCRTASLMPYAAHVLPPGRLWGRS